MTVSMKALRAMRYAGKQVSVGDVFEASPQDAKVLEAIRSAALVVEDRSMRATPTPIVKDDAEKADEAEPAKKNYRRRDMKAEQ